MLLTIDIGNSTISLGVFRGSRLVTCFSVPTDVKKPVSSYIGFLKRSIKGIDAVIICSVVPKMTGILTQAVKKAYKIRPAIVGKDIVVPIKNRYRKPAQVGQDRLVNAYAGLKMHGTPLIIIDFGTAVTFDIVSKKGEYRGGIIAPGLNTSLKSLREHTALLPAISLAKPVEVIGRDTAQSMLSGVVFGLAELTQGLIRRLKKEIGSGARVIGTGGHIALMKPLCKDIIIADQRLTLKGLQLLYLAHNRR